MPKKVFPISVMGINLHHDFCYDVVHSGLSLCGKTPFFPKTCTNLRQFSHLTGLTPELKLGTIFAKV